MNPRDAKKRNIRDLSYLSLRDGKHLKKGRFFRSASLRKFSRKGIKELQEAHLSTVIDLRTVGEVSKKPDELWGGVAYKEIPIVEAATLGITHEKGLKAYKKPPVMTELYADIVTNPKSVAALRQVMDEIFASRGGSILWHCTEGKDRCGLVSALFLLALGCNEEDVFLDYEKSNARSEKKGRLYRFLLRIFFFGEELAQGVYRAMLAHRDYLRAALDAINTKFGSLDSFLQNELGLTKERIDAFLSENAE